MLPIPWEKHLREAVFHRTRNGGLLQNRSGAPAEEEEVELRERDSDGVRELPPPILNLPIAAGRKGAREEPDHAVADEVPEDVPVEEREAVREADVPEEVGGLLHRETVALPDEPFPRGLRGRERGERLLQRPPPPGSEPVPRSDDVRGLVIVEPDPGAEERRNRRRVPRKEEAPLLEAHDRRIRRPRLRLNRQDAECDLFEEALVALPPLCLEFFEPSPYRGSSFLVLSPEGTEVVICESTAHAASRASGSGAVRTRPRGHRTSEENPGHNTTS